MLLLQIISLQTFLSLEIKRAVQIKKKLKSTFSRLLCQIFLNKKSIEDPFQDQSFDNEQIIQKEGS